jgi:hypothetical protein
MKSFSRWLTVLGTLTIFAACGDSGSGPGGINPTDGVLDFETDVIRLFETRSTSVNLINGTDTDVGPVSFRAGSTFDVRNIDVGGVKGTALPPFVPTMRPGGKASVSVNLNPTGLPTGSYETIFEARVDGQTRATVRLLFDVLAGSTSSAVSVQITDGPTTLKQGDPVSYAAEARNNRDEQLPAAFVEWFVLPTGAGDLSPDGRFVPFTAGAARIIARSGVHFDTLNINITPRNASGSLQLVGRGQNAGSEDLSVKGDFAYLATSTGAVETWNIADPTSPTLTSTLVLDAARIPSVHIRADGQLGVAAHFGSEDALNGVTLFDLTDPSTPTVLSRFTEGLTAGVTTVFLDGDHLYATVEDRGVRVIDVSDPAAPVTAAEFTLSQSFANEVVVEDGLLYIAYWNAGAFVVDVGNGVAGGSPANPIQVATFTSSGGQIASVARWPERSLAFLSEDDVLTPGVIHVMDIADLGDVSEVATWATPNLAPGPVVVDPGSNRLFAAWRSAGVRMLDGSDVLESKLERQGREIAVSLYDGATTNAVRIRLVGDLVFVADGNSGLVILRAG